MKRLLLAILIFSLLIMVDNLAPHQVPEKKEINLLLHPETHIYTHETFSPSCPLKCFPFSTFQEAQGSRMTDSFAATVFGKKIKTKQDCLNMYV